MTDLTELVQDSENFTNPEKFHEMLDKARQPQEEPPAEEEPLVDDEPEAEAVEEEEEPAVDEAPEEEEQPKEINIPKWRFDQVQENNRDLKQQNEMLLKFIEENVNKNEPAQSDEFDPVDEIADKKYSKKFEELDKKQQEIAQQIQMKQVADAITHQEGVARQKYSDFDAAYQHYVNVKLEEVRALGYSDDEAKQVVHSGLVNTAVGALRNQRQLGDVFYSLAKASGYKAAKPAGERKDKLEENRAKTERRPVERAAPDTSNMDAIGELRSKYKSGQRVSNEDFKKLLARVRKT